MKIKTRRNICRYTNLNICLGNSGAVVTCSPPTSEVCGSSRRPYVGKWVVAYRWSAVHSTETALVSSAHKKQPIIIWPIHC